MSASRLSCFATPVSQACLTREDAWRRRGGALFRIALLGTAIGLSGCASLSPARWFGPSDTAVVGQVDSETIATAARAGAAWERRPADPEAAVAYARSLRQMGNAREGVFVLQRAVSTHPNNAAVIAEYAKCLTAAGRSTDALPLFAMAKRLNPGDWTVVSAEGIALDQIGRHAEARKAYGEALRLSPGNPDILSNLALSHTLSGDLAEAESILRSASSQPRSSGQIRQNLALVLVLQGKYGEAERLALADADPARASEEVAAMRETFAGPARYAEAREVEAAAAASASLSEAAAVADSAPIAPERQPAIGDTVEPLASAARPKPAAGEGITATTAPRAVPRPAIRPRPAVQSMAETFDVAGNDIDDSFYGFGDERLIRPN